MRANIRQMQQLVALSDFFFFCLCISLCLPFSLWSLWFVGQCAFTYRCTHIDESHIINAHKTDHPAFFFFFFFRSFHQQH